MSKNEIQSGVVYMHKLTGEYVVPLYVKSWSSGNIWVCRCKNYALRELHYSELTPDPIPYSK